MNPIKLRRLILGLTIVFLGVILIAVILGKIEWFVYNKLSFIFML